MSVGIDLGTTYSKMGYVHPQSGPVLIPDARDPQSLLTPSIVHLGVRGCLVGQPVASVLEDDPNLHVLQHIKLMMGRQAVAHSDHLGREWSPEAVSALILRKLKQDAEAFGGRQIENSVITVPAQFGHAERRATREAALLAGLPGVRIIDEPVAAAVYYGIAEEPDDETIFVYDLGGGTFDATVVQVDSNGIYVLATEGSNKIGGKWFNDVIGEVIASQFEQRYHYNPLSDPVTAMQISRYAEDAKLKLSSAGKSQVKQTLLIGGKPSDFLLTRTQFEALIEPLLRQSVEVCRRCLKGASLEWKDINRVLLIGGSTWIPAIKKMMQEETGRAADQVFHKQPHHAVAYGASLLAHEGNSGAQRLRQAIAGSSLGIRVIDPVTGAPAIHTVIPRNVPLPASGDMTSYTTRHDQNRMVVEVVQTKGEAETARSLGHFVFGPLPRPRKNYPIEVSMAYDAEGIVKIGARDPESGIEIGHQLSEDDGEWRPLTFNAERDLVSSVRINEWN